MLKNSVGNKVIPTEFAQFNFFLVMKIDFRVRLPWHLHYRNTYAIMSASFCKSKSTIKNKKFIE